VREYLNENTLFNTVAMFLDESEGLLLVLEGPDDHLLLRGSCTPQLQLLTATGGRPQVLSTAQLAHDRGLRRARFLVDQDYDRYNGSTETQLDNVLVSDHHDCFVDLMCADRSLLHRVIEVHCDAVRRRGDQTVNAPDPAHIETEAFMLASKLAATRIVDARRRLFLDFKRFRFGGLATADFDVTKIAEIVLTRSQYAGEDRNEILADAVSAHSEIAGMRHSPVGDHDLFAALARVMQEYEVYERDANLQRGFILAVSCDSLIQTSWCKALQQWCMSYGMSGFTCDPQPLAS
jgi:hypothetical protein